MDAKKVVKQIEWTFVGSARNGPCKRRAYTRMPAFCSARVSCRRLDCIWLDARTRVISCRPPRGRVVNLLLLAAKLAQATCCLRGMALGGVGNVATWQLGCATSIMRNAWLVLFMLPMKTCCKDGCTGSMQFPHCGSFTFICSLQIWTLWR